MCLEGYAALDLFWLRQELSLPFSLLFRPSDCSTRSLHSFIVHTPSASRPQQSFVVALAAPSIFREADQWLTYGCPVMDGLKRQLGSDAWTSPVHGLNFWLF